MMENWKKAYLEALKLTKSNTRKTKGVLLGFNVNIDKIVPITPSILKKIEKNLEASFSLSREKHVERIKTKEDLLSCLINAIEKGKADEVLIVDEIVAIWIEEHFSILESAIGGQAGIMANLLCNLNVSPIMLSSPLYNSKLSGYLAPSIIVPQTMTDLPPEPCPSEEKIIPITHYIFEFKEGIYEFNNEKIECKRSNRFIGSYDKHNSLLSSPKEFFENSLASIQDYSLAVISGFHLIDTENITENSMLDVLHPILVLINKWKNMNPDLKIHLELASTKSEILRKGIKENLFPIVDSTGFNEQELLSFLEILDYSTYELIQSELNSVNLLKGIMIFHREYPHLRLHLHYYGFFLLLCPLLNEADMIKERNGLLISSLFAAVKAKNGVVKSQKEIQDITIDLSESGIKDLVLLDKYIKKEFFVRGNLLETGCINSQSFTLIGIPTIVISKPKQLVGLGDTISLTSLLYANIDEH